MDKKTFILIYFHHIVIDKEALNMQIIILISNLFIPLIMIALGHYFSNHAPSKINYIFGYRTSMSMKNQETWNFAHHHFGTMWKRFGFILLIFSIISSLFINDANKETVCMMVYSVQLIILITPIFFTERALRKNFTTDGNPIT